MAFPVFFLYSISSYYLFALMILLLNFVKETENLLYVPVVCASLTLNSSKAKRRRRAQETVEEEGSKGDGKYTHTNTQSHTLNQLYICLHMALAKLQIRQRV
jgi:hypothetical protein